jgi:phage/plasmid-like protein (TIGR03299 family)
MAHELHYSEKLGRYAVYVCADHPSWHKLERPNIGILTWEGVYDEIDGFETEVNQLEYQGLPVDAWGVFRTDSNTLISTCGKSYEPHPMKYGFSWVDSLLNQENGIHYSSAGILGNGEKYWLMARVPQADISVMDRDKHESYLLFVTSFDGTIPTTVKLVNTCVVCQNTLSMGLREKGAAHKVRHTKNSKAKLNEVKDLMTSALASADVIKEKFETLARREMTEPIFNDVLNRLFPVKNADGPNTRRNNTLNSIIDIYESGINAEAFPEFQGSAYQLLQAITDYTDHERGVRKTEGKTLSENALRSESALFGSGANFKETALEVLLECTNGAPEKKYTTYIQRAIQKGEAERAQERIETPILESILDLS